MQQFTPEMRSQVNKDLEGPGEHDQEICLQVPELDK